MGFDETRFLDPVTEEFKCLICSEVLEEPIECSGCQTNFCTSCINDWKARSDECPNRCKLTLQQCHRGFKNLWQRLRLRCANASRGCEMVITIEALGKHEGNECLYRSVQCGNTDCGTTLPAKDLPQHLDTCPFGSLVCEQCKTSYLRRDAESHDCVQSLVAAYKDLQQTHETLKADVAELSRNVPAKPEQKPVESQQMHYGVACSGCHKEPIQGVRYMCQKCIAYDLCEQCLRKILHGHNDYWPIPMALEHEGITCDGCRTRPIAGPRYKCKRCPDFDYCHACKVSIPHQHSDFDAFLPYWVTVIPLAEERTAYHPGETLVRSWMLLNHGPEVLRDPVLTLFRGDPCCNLSSGSKTNEMFKCELPPDCTFIVSFSAAVTQTVPGTYTSEWKMSTTARVSFFGPKLTYRLIVL